ncbi:MAG: amidohydrolase [Magnetococcales bacterium]|nr:amidohydrolase [Magnetococcales bacterium]
MNLFIHNVFLEGRAGPLSILIKDGRIEQVGSGEPNETGSNPSTFPRLDARGMTALPGLVNGHTHAAMTLFRGAGDDLPLETWLKERIWPAEARLSAEDVYWGTRLACLEMIRCGTVVFQDGYWHYHAVARAVHDSGLRASLGMAMVDAQGPEQGKVCKETAMEIMRDPEHHGPHIRPILFPHSIYAVTPGNLRWCARFSADHDLGVHIHLSENRWEVEACLRQHGMRPAFHLDALGLLHERCILAHGVFLDDAELELIARRGATLVTNPTSNLKLAVGGIFPYGRVASLGIPVGLGSDGAASNNSLDLFSEMKTFALIQKHATEDPTTLPAPQVLDIAQGRKAPLLGASGLLAPGQPADLLLIDTNDPSMTPPLNLASNLVYSATGHVVDTTIVAGRILMKHRIIDDEEDIRREVANRARSLLGHGTPS